MPALALGGVHHLALREYQEEAIAAINAAEERGIRRQLGVAATGLGKTVILASLAAGRGDRTLILAHRDELINQAAEKVRLWWPDADVGIVKAERNETWAQDVIVASVQSLSPARLARLGHFGLVVVDEAHRSRAPSYGRILDGLGCGPTNRSDSGPLLLGVTATPDRGDGKGLDSIFDEIVFNYDLLWGIRAGFLCDVRATEVKLADLHLENVTVRQGDYAEGELGAALTAANAPRHIVQAWRQHASDRLTLVFMPTVETAYECAAEFAAAGIQASAVDGSEKMETRRRKLGDFAAGRIRVLCNVDVCSEGLDIPAIDCVVMGGPTKSRGRFVQRIGRGTRPYPAKSDLLVIDVVGDSENLSLCSVPSLFGVTKREMGRKGALQAVSDKEAAERAKQAATAPTGGSQAKLVARDVDLFRQVQEQGKVAWTKIHGGRSFAVSVGDASVVVERQAEDRYDVLVVRKEGEPEVLMSGAPLALATGVTEDYARKHGTSRYIDKGEKWRMRAPSPKQLDAARKWHIPVDQSWNAGQVSEAITAAIAAARLARSRKEVKT